jgi:hypothetical protein
MVILDITHVIGGSDHGDYASGSDNLRAGSRYGQLQL